MKFYFMMLNCPSLLIKILTGSARQQQYCFVWNTYISSPGFPYFSSFLWFCPISYCLGKLLQIVYFSICFLFRFLVKSRIWRTFIATKQVYSMLARRLKNGSKLESRLASLYQIFSDFKTKSELNLFQTREKQSFGKGINVSF